MNTCPFCKRECEDSLCNECSVIESRVAAYEDMGMTRGDAQGVVEAENLT